MNFIKEKMKDFYLLDSKVEKYFYQRIYACGTG